MGYGSEKDPESSKNSRGRGISQAPYPTPHTLYPAFRGPSWPLGGSNLVAGSELVGQRLDVALTPLFGSARAVREALASGFIFYNGAAPSGAARLREGDVVSCFSSESDPGLRPEAISLPVLYED